MPVLRGEAAEWLALYARPGAEGHLAKALGLPPLDQVSTGDLAALAVARDLGIVVARVRTIDDPGAVAVRWRFSEATEPGEQALVIPVGMDGGRSYYEPGQLVLSLGRHGEDLFLDSLCDLVAMPLEGGFPLSMTGDTLAVGRFALRERGEVEIFAAGITWLRAHLDRARELEAELPAHLVAQQLETPDHFCTLVLAPKAIEWRPSMLNYVLPAGAKALMVRDSLGLARLIEAQLRWKPKPPRRPAVFGPSRVAVA